MIFKRAQQAPVAMDTPLAASGTPDAIKEKALDTAKKDPAAEQKDITEQCNLSFKKQYGIYVDKKIRADSLVDRYNKMYTTVSSMFNERKNKSILAGINFVPEPCSVVSVDQNVAIGAEDVIAFYSSWIKVAEEYLRSLRDQVAVNEELESKFAEFLSGNGLCSAQNVSTSLEFVDIGNQVAIFKTQYENMEQAIQMAKNENRQMMAFAPLKIEYMDVMSDLCEVKTRYEKTKAMVGVGNRQDLDTLISYYGRAIKVVKKVAVTAKAVYGSTPEYKRMKKGIDNLIQELEKAQLLLSKETFTRLFPGYGK